MLKQANELTFPDKKFSMLIYGSPGLGKTTLALSAPDPVLIDFDDGISRVKALHRKQTIICDTYEEVLKDLENPLVVACQTIIVDTGGSFITFLQDWAMRSNPALNTQKNGAISLKGFGTVKSEFVRFTERIKRVMKKNVIYVFHSVEEKDKDGSPIQRLQCEGSARNIVWQPCDFGAYMQMIGNKRYLSFTPEQEFYCKGCHGIYGRREVPELTAKDDNDYLTRLFNEARENIAAEDATGITQKEQKEQYDIAMREVHQLVDDIKTVEDATNAADRIANIQHALTSLVEARRILKDKLVQLGYTWDKEQKKYVEAA